MAAQDKSGFQKAESPENDQTPDDDAVWVDRPGEGESIQGILLERTEEAGEFDSPLYKLRRTDDYEDETNRDGETAGPVVLMWSNGSIDRTITHNNITPGDEVLIEGTGTYTSEIDGEEQECVNYEVFFN
jgi:hypothetical protein